MAATQKASRDRCDDDAGRLAPVIDRNRCEGKEDCVQVCPYDVFEMGVLTSGEFWDLSLVGKLKAVGHRYRQAYTPNAADCHACGHCVEACPEKAIKLAKTAA
ncbi:MAG: 4Fe-4S dicluster domain-containing protein [Candidatus Binatia bacterium]|nr:4Fe-4S dicluster domain-containing protein [Candidatus Binatia bacterium]